MQRILGMKERENEYKNEGRAFRCFPFWAIQGTKYPQDYAPEVLETFINKHQDHDYFVKFNCPEFTSLCPMTGQPDFATIYISYVPDVRMVESKSLKLYLFSFRNHGDFHEDCVNIIMKDLIRVMDPSISRCGASSRRGEESPSIHTPIMESRAPAGRKWRLIVWSVMICIRKKWTIDKNEQIFGNTCFVFGFVLYYPENRSKRRWNYEQ